MNHRFRRHEKNVYDTHGTKTNIHEDMIHIIDKSKQTLKKSALCYSLDRSIKGHYVGSTFSKRV